MNRTHEDLLTPFYDADTRRVDLSAFAAKYDIDTIAAMYSAGGCTLHEDAYLAGYHHNRAVGCGHPKTKQVIKRGWLVTVSERMAWRVIGVWFVAFWIVGLVALMG
jgi:hypothetical protein